MNERGPWVEHLMQDEGLTYAQAAEYLDGYELIPYVDNGEHMATLIKKNAEVHFCIYRQYRGKGHVTMRRIREFLLPILDSEGFLTTKLADGEPDTFIKRLGFEEIGRSTSHRIFMLNTITPLERRHAQLP